MQLMPPLKHIRSPWMYKIMSYREEAPGRFLKLQKVYSTYSTRVQIYFYSYSIELSIFLTI